MVEMLKGELCSQRVWIRWNNLEVFAVLKSRKCNVDLLCKTRRSRAAKGGMFAGRCA